LLSRGGCSVPKYWEDFAVGDSYLKQKGLITEEDVYSFASLSHDFDPIYLDDEYAVRGPYGHRVVHGLLLISKMMGLFYENGTFNGTSLGIIELSCRMIHPVSIGENILFEAKVENLAESHQSHYGILYSLFHICNEQGQVVQEGKFASLIRKSLIPHK
jgi:3-hydroxybutyryl-CoA dehydratase